MNFDQNSQKTGHFPSSQILIPSKVLANRSVSFFESLVVYLVEERKISFSDIGKLLARDRRTIWTTYTRAKSKPFSPSQISKNIFIPLQIFANRNLSILESLVDYFTTSTDLSNKEIALLLDRSPKTIWTIKKRVSDKK